MAGRIKVRVELDIVSWTPHAAQSPFREVNSASNLRILSRCCSRSRSSKRMLSAHFRSFRLQMRPGAFPFQVLLQACSIILRIIKLPHKHIHRLRILKTGSFEYLIGYLFINSTDPAFFQQEFLRQGGSERFVTEMYLGRYGCCTVKIGRYMENLLVILKRHSAIQSLFHLLEHGFFHFLLRHGARRLF